MNRKKYLMNHIRGWLPREPNLPSLHRSINRNHERSHIIRAVVVTVFFACWFLVGLIVLGGIPQNLLLLFLVGTLAVALFLMLAFRKEISFMKANRWAEISMRNIRIKCVLLFLILSLFLSIHHYLISTPVTTLLIGYASLWFLGIVVILSAPIMVRDLGKSESRQN
jgi:hypothetical protein